MRGKWTEGPWKVQHDLIVSKATWDTICAVKRPSNAASTFLGDDDEHALIEAANARLIAAAPAMADVLAAAPIVSAYHAAKGFEVERFLADYEAWSATKRAALSLAHTEPSQGEK